MIFYHVISDLPKKAGDHLRLDAAHPNRVRQRVMEQLQAVEDIYRHPEAYAGKDLSHEVRVALRELALEKVRQEKYPQYPSRLASLYVSATYEEAERWADYFIRLGRQTYGIAKIAVHGNLFSGDASKCFDGTPDEEKNLRLAELYWQNGPNDNGAAPITEILADGDIEIVAITKEISARASKPVIETRRLLLREYTPDDFDALYEILSDPETMVHYPVPYDAAGTRRWITWNLENYEKYGFGLWAAVLKESGELIGDCGVTMQNIDGDTLPEIGYHIHKKFWRQGYACEAARAVRDWAFEQTPYPALYSYMKFSNEASWRTAMANGMKKVKEYPDPKDGILYAFAITRAEWQALKE